MCTATNLHNILLQNTETGLVAKRRAVGSVHLDFSKALDTISCKTVPEKLIKCRMSQWQGG